MYDNVLEILNENLIVCCRKTVKDLSQEDGILNLLYDRIRKDGCSDIVS